jgi:phosphatidylinositol-3-phosphatase
MYQATLSRAARALVLFGVLESMSASAQNIKTVFVIAMENHNWTQPAQVSGGIEQLYGNPHAPFINSLVNGTAWAMVNGVAFNISQQVAYAKAYHNVQATPDGNNPHIHPSESNYIWAEAGTNFGVFNDNDPFTPGGSTNQNTSLHLSNLLTLARRTWKSYQEDIDLARDPGGQLTNTPLPQNVWTVPLSGFSGTFAAGYANAYNRSGQYEYAPKHNPMVLFSDTNGGDNPYPGNPAATHYAPLQQLAADLANNTVAGYNWITPNLYNDMHNELAAGFKGLSGDAASIRQGDNFLRRIVPMIMSSNAYSNGGAIILWWDETESDGVPGDNEDDFNHTLGEIIISPYAHANVGGVPYASPVNYTHSSDLRTIEEIFGLGVFLGDSANASDLSDLFAPGVIPRNP